MEIFFYALACLFLGFLTIVMPKDQQLNAHYLAGGLSTVGSALVLFAGLGFYLPLGLNYQPWSFGSYSLVVDSWSGFFLILTGLAGVTTSIYSLGYAQGYLGARLRILGSLWNLFILSMVLVLLAGDALTFLVFWEIMAVASFLLVNQECEKKVTWNAAYQYLVMTSLGTTALMVAFFLLAAGSRDFTFAALAQNSLTPGLKQGVFIAAFLGFALKAGLVPLHVWLPNAHPAAPSHVSALMSGVMLKIALYGFGRFMLQFIPDWQFWWGALVTIVGCFSAFLGVLYAQMETDIKRILAYSSVENMGVIFAAFGCGMLLKVVEGGNWYYIGIMAALLHGFNHSIMKTLMFMCAGSIMHATGSKNLELFGGMAKTMPLTAVFTCIGSMALAALPLTCGFTGEWMTLQSFITLATATSAQSIRVISAISFILLGFTGALALGCFVRFFGITFLGRARSEIAVHAHEADSFMLTGMGLASAMVLVLGIFPQFIVSLLYSTLNINSDVIMRANIVAPWSLTNPQGSLLPIALLLALCFLGYLLYNSIGSHAVFIEKDVTWNCGTYPTERQQYSAIGFSKPVRRAFDYLLNPVREKTYVRKENAYFGRQLEFKLSLPDMVDQKIYQPFNKHFIRISSFLRHLQEGSVRLYAGYVMAAMVAVLVWGAMYK